MATRVPFDTFNTALMSLPYSNRILWHINCPQIYFRLTCCCQLTIILPCNVNNLTWLMKLIHWLLLNCIWVPYEYICLVSTGCNKCIRFVPARTYKRILSSEQTLKLTLHVPDTRYIIIRTCQKTITRIAPLD